MNDTNSLTLELELVGLVAKLVEFGAKLVGLGDMLVGLGDELDNELNILVKAFEICEVDTSTT